MTKKQKWICFFKIESGMLLHVSWEYLCESTAMIKYSTYRPTMYFSRMCAWKQKFADLKICIYAYKILKIYVM